MIDYSKYDNFYINYHKIDTRSYYERIRFYEKNLIAVSLLDPIKKLEIDIDYAICLFEIGNYHNYVNLVEPLIVAVIKENIKTYRGRDIYIDLLFKKSASLFNIGLYNSAYEIAKQILSMHSDERIILLYNKCKRAVLVNHLMWLKGVVVALLLSGVMISIISILVIKPFFEMHFKLVEHIRNIFFIVGVSILILQELYLMRCVRKELIILHRKRNSKTKNYEN